MDTDSTERAIITADIGSSDFLLQMNYIPGMYAVRYMEDMDSRRRPPPARVYISTPKLFAWLMPDYHSAVRVLHNRGIGLS